MSDTVQYTIIHADKDNPSKVEKSFTAWTFTDALQALEVYIDVNDLGSQDIQEITLTQLTQFNAFGQ